jgi:phage terminase large subunit-like protein
MTRSLIMSLADEKAYADGCRLSLLAADRVAFFFRTFLRHSKGQFAGKPFELLDWQFNDVIAPLFGWKRPDGTRRYRRAYIEVPKKNGKSTLAAGIALYLLLGDDEPGAEVYSAAADRDQASIVFNEALAMVRASPALSSRLKAVASMKRILNPKTESWYQALSAEVHTKEGLNIHGLIFDELHAQPTRALWDTLIYGGAARRQPLSISITTAGYDKESICYEQHRYAKAILAGEIVDHQFFSFIAAAQEEDDWTDPAVWRKANPSYGITISEDSFKADALEAQNSAARENAFRRYRLNQWTEQDVRWLQMERWDECDIAIVYEGEIEPLAGKLCYAGLDLASTTDLAALVLLFPDTDGSYDILCWFWAPERACRERERTNKTRYDAWVRQGLITQTPGDVVDYDRIRVKILELGELYDIREIAIDRWNSTQLATQLQGDGFEVVGFGQGFASMTAPTKELESLMLSGKLRHGGNPVLRWMAGNVTVETDAAGNLKPSKKKSTEKIDGIVALIMALGRAMVRPELDSVYDGQGVDLI